MKNIIYLFTSVTVILTLLSSCEKDKSSEGVSRITNYPTFDLQGGSLIFHEEGTPFKDPGVTATEAGEELDVTSSTVGVFRAGSVAEVDGNMADHYIKTYSATNQDGFAGTATRDVWVATTGDLVNSIEGIYTSTVLRDGDASAQYTDMEYILIWKNADGTYGISDGIGGYYDIGRAYGYAYAASGFIITANDIANNDFSFNNPQPVGAFGGAASMRDMVVDPVAGTVSFSTDWDAGFTFEVTLTQVQF